MTLYLVRFDGLIDVYGEESYLLGIYDSSDEAIAAKELFDREHEKYNLEAIIEEVVLNQTYDVRIEHGWGASTSIYLGGWSE